MIIKTFSSQHAIATMKQWTYQQTAVNQTILQRPPQKVTVLH